MKHVTFPEQTAEDTYEILSPPKMSGAQNLQVADKIKQFLKADNEILLIGSGGSAAAVRLLQRIGNFCTNLKIILNYDFFLRAYNAGVKAKYIDIPLSVMRKTGISSQLDWPSLKKRFAEKLLVHLKNCSHSFLKFLYQVYWSLYLPYRYLLYCV